MSLNSVVCVKEDSLVAGGSGGKHIRLEFGEKALLVFSLANLHIQQVRMDGRVIDLSQPLLNGLGWRAENKAQVKCCMFLFLFKVLKMRVTLDCLM